MNPPANSGIRPAEISWRTVVAAKRLMRAGYDLYEAAKLLGVRARDLDISLWRAVGEEGWA